MNGTRAMIEAGTVLAVAPPSSTWPLAIGVLGVIGVGWAERCRRRSVVRRRCAADRAFAAPSGTRDSRPGRPITDRGRRDRVADALGWWHAQESAAGRTARRLTRRPADAEADQRLGRVIVVVLAVLVVVGPVPATVTGFAMWAAPLVRRASRRARRRSALVDETPEIVDLIRLGVGSGLNVRLSLEAVVRHHRGLIAAELEAVLARVTRGDRLADALDSIGPDAEALGPLVDALVATERYGAPLVASLDRVAGDARTARRRRREEAARRVPVKLLFPLVFCTLPAFALLTVVPVLLRSLPSLAP